MPYNEETVMETYKKRLDIQILEGFLHMADLLLQN